ncbi:hypothetical protein H696_04813 [Fonticula alba]|uniref:Survival Motor Neuron Gemin2-binding domain-containing protein n=1 Tax=Fonticula alba TaxID=691883 RepID=A0A058Z342_FONAL|nr:hypothetical protein H696_04813 [Fonticula alba]KCV68521.1 hypothetical protein H696_04813 [Fonticula alba]|eukprot:XP_009496953.1 hypothetical protein H696_04813 [Fonticula alba]
MSPPPAVAAGAPAAPEEELEDPALGIELSLSPDAWDDTPLIKAWDSAIQSFRAFHGRPSAAHPRARRAPPSAQSTARVSARGGAGAGAGALPIPSQDALGSESEADASADDEGADTCVVADADAEIDEEAQEAQEEDAEVGAKADVSPEAEREAVPADSPAVTEEAMTASPGRADPRAAEASYAAWQWYNHQSAGMADTGAAGAAPWQWQPPGAMGGESGWPVSGPGWPSSGPAWAPGVAADASQTPAGPADQLVDSVLGSDADIQANLSMAWYYAGYYAAMANASRLFRQHLSAKRPAPVTEPSGPSPAPGPEPAPAPAPSPPAGVKRRRQ